MHTGPPRKGGSRHYHNHASRREDGYNHARKNDGNRTDVVKIGSRELSRENLAKKDFLALMNKMTVQNQAQIAQSIKNVFREDCVSIYVQILWDFMQRASDFLPLYMHALDVLMRASQSRNIWDAQWREVWDKFCHTKGWAPAAHLLQEEDYDEFCDFVKWKKRTTGALKACVALARQGMIPQETPRELIQNILHDCDEALSLSHVGCKLTDAFLEQIQTLLCEREEECIPSLVVPWISHKKEAGLSSLRPSTRFKMYDIWDACPANMKKTP